jgi:hypothetical protein
MNDLILILQQVKANWGIETVNAIKDKIQQDQIIWNSNLLNSIQSIQDSSLDGDISFKMADYGEFVDEGTGLNGPRKQAIPKESIPGIAYWIKPWADSKGLNNFAVATSIVNKGGLEPRRFFKDVIASRLEVLGKDVERAYTTYLNEQINKQQNP